MARPTRRRKSNQTPASSSSAAGATPQPFTASPDGSPARADDARPSPRAHEPTHRIDARPHLENAAASKKRNGVLSAIAQSTIPAWAQTLVMVSLIFGGCCSNVFALEAIVKSEPGSGHLITFFQFLLVAFEGFLHHFDSSSPYFLKKNQIPIHRWLIQIALFFSVNVLNNYAFDFNISVPVHIILRSGGSMTTLAVGWLAGKKYSRVQMLSVLVLTVGCVMAAMGDANGMGESEQNLARFLTGLGILFIAQVLSAVMGLYIEATYAKYGNNYREGLFYTHAISLILFLPFSRGMRSQFAKLASSSPLPASPYLPPVLNTLITNVPRQLLFLGINSLTQYVCIRGVNMLGAMASALTVTIVLNIRKLVSLLLSIWLFGNKLNAGVMAGAGVVFAGGLVYGLESQRQGRLRRERERKRQ